jgi:Icc-related predicted phosphoesterase
LLGLHLFDEEPDEGPRPSGATNADGRVIEAAGLRIAGLGGCVRYKPGPNQYTQREYHRLARQLLRRTRRGGPVDVLLTHAPPLGLGDGEDRPHEGIAALHTVIERLQPSWNLHGHIHPYGQPTADRELGRTTIRNVIPWRMVDIEPRSPHQVVASGAPARM